MSDHALGTDAGRGAATVATQFRRGSSAATRSGRESERHARPVHDPAQLRHQVVRDRHAPFEPLRPRRHLRVARDQRGLLRVGAPAAVQRVDHLVEIVLERSVLEARGSIAMTETS